MKINIQYLYSIEEEICCCVFTSSFKLWICKIERKLQKPKGFWCVSAQKKRREGEIRSRVFWCRRRGICTSSSGGAAAKTHRLRKRCVLFPYGSSSPFPTGLLTKKNKVSVLSMAELTIQFYGMFII